MPSSKTIVTSEHASKYLQQLCKHWSHKLPVEFDPQTGWVRFDDERICHFAASGNSLEMRLETQTQEQLERTQNTVIVHLKRFAFREDFGDVAWTADS